MTDLELTKLCGAAMNIHDADEIRLMNNGFYYAPSIHGNIKYSPLNDDEQAMALVKKFKLTCDAPNANNNWIVGLLSDERKFTKEAAGIDTNLNHAICECVAKMQTAKSGT